MAKRSTAVLIPIIFISQPSRLAFPLSQELPDPSLRTRMLNPLSRNMDSPVGSHVYIFLNALNKITQSSSRLRWEVEVVV